MVLPPFVFLPHLKWAPKPPREAYVFFVDDPGRPKVHAETLGSLAVFDERLRDQWCNLSKEERAPYVAQAEADIDRYRDEKLRGEYNHSLFILANHLPTFSLDLI